MAAPMLLMSCTAKSCTRPNVTESTGTPCPPCARTRQAPAAVAVHWAVGVRLAPYSSGVRNCRSAAQKWLLVSAMARSAIPDAANAAASPNVSAIVEHAPYTPANGTPSSRIV